MVVGNGFEPSFNLYATQSNGLPSTHTVYTIWIRVTRNGAQLPGGDTFYTDANGVVGSVGTVVHHDMWVN
ncbi:MAG: hypothetical protein QM723_30680 [Myxococcaceae bacterium]